MTRRKLKLRITQLGLLFFGLIIILLTYNKNTDQDKIITDEVKKRIVQDSEKVSEDESGIFKNVSYSNFDLEGNRYILKAGEAKNSQEKQEIINMNFVSAVFYFKDNTTLKVTSDEGRYNNKTLDMLFSKNVEAFYEGSKLFAQKAEYSNSESYLIISDGVKIRDVKGNMIADELLFDIKKKTLNISSKDDKKINTNVNIK
tara:strand:- start:8882 stop:9484 length:603 start_codon:yes stop_codon:yes gene_type:complete